jgi:hypothetical protein
MVTVTMGVLRLGGLVSPILPHRTPLAKPRADGYSSTMPPARSPNTTVEDLAAVILGRPLRDWVRDRRNAPHSWDRIAADLRAETSWRVDVTRETLRNWYPDPPTETD